MKIKAFHQMVLLEKGPVNTAILDLLKGNTFQVENYVIEAFYQKKYNEIDEFITAAEDEDLLIEIDEDEWIPKSELSNRTPLDELPVDVVIEVDQGADIQLVKEKLSSLDISSVVYYGDEQLEPLFSAAEMIRKEKNYNICIDACRVTGSFESINRQYCSFNNKFNTCWGRKIAITKDNVLRPCIYSEISLGDLKDIQPENIMEIFKDYWFLTPEKVENCKDCELKLVCFNCREEAYRKTGDVKGANPHCGYDPNTGEWMEEN